jgi:hypothetical protein
VKILFYQYLQLAASFHLSSSFSRAAARAHVVRKLRHAKATLEEHALFKFVVGGHYECNAQNASHECADYSVQSGASCWQRCILVGRLQHEYEVELLSDHRRLRVAVLREIPIQPVDSCDWSDAAYVQDTFWALDAIAADFPNFALGARGPQPLTRTLWPIMFYHPPGTSNVRAQMEFYDVDYGVHFAPFLSEAALPSLAGNKREALLKTVRWARAASCCKC